MPNRLTRYELELMNVLWDLSEGTVQDVCSGLDRNLAYTTVMTTLNLLHSKKGVLERVKKGRAFVYSPAVSREYMSMMILDDLKPVLFGKSLPSLVLGMLSREQLEDDDLDAIRQAIEKVECKLARRKKNQ